MRTIKKRRRLENKTDYKSRLVMLKSELPRVVFRKTNKYIIGQLVRSNEARDEISVGLDSRSLIDYGWPKDSKSIKSSPAAYLTGFLLGKKIVDKEGEIRAIFDLGLQRSIAKSRAYAFLKGVIDAGVKISCNEEMFPDESRISGKQLKNSINVEPIKQKIEKEA
ncbi:MAG: 50S ribosomal protein L18 [Nanoarchaeota archaeon]|nr:50S ribosomal protein L18 [Nanoarchaeota archaeon]MBU4086568.1 50S ribosomal protein L18 [Nanoarchaeota archaeon]